MPRLLCSREGQMLLAAADEPMNNRFELITEGVKTYVPSMEAIFVNVPKRAQLYGTVNPGPMEPKLLAFLRAVQGADFEAIPEWDSVEGNENVEVIGLNSPVELLYGQWVFPSAEVADFIRCPNTEFDEDIPLESLPANARGWNLRYGTEEDNYYWLSRQLRRKIETPRQDLVSVYETKGFLGLDQRCIREFSRAEAGSWVVWVDPVELKKVDLVDMSRGIKANDKEAEAAFVKLFKKGKLRLVDDVQRSFVVEGMEAGAGSGTSIGLVEFELIVSVDSKLLDKQLRDIPIVEDMLGWLRSSAALSSRRSRHQDSDGDSNGGSLGSGLGGRRRRSVVKASATTPGKAVATDGAKTPAKEITKPPLPPPKTPVAKKKSTPAKAGAGSGHGGGPVRCSEPPAPKKKKVDKDGTQKPRATAAEVAENLQKELASGSAAKVVGGATHAGVLQSADQAPDVKRTMSNVAVELSSLRRAVDGMGKDVDKLAKETRDRVLSIKHRLDDQPTRGEVDELLQTANSSLLTDIKGLLDQKVETLAEKISDKLGDKVETFRMPAPRQPRRSMGNALNLAIDETDFVEEEQPLLEALKVTTADWDDRLRSKYWFFFQPIRSLRSCIREDACTKITSKYYMSQMTPEDFDNMSPILEVFRAPSPHLMDSRDEEDLEADRLKQLRFAKELLVDKSKDAMRLSPIQLWYILRSVSRATLEGDINSDVPNLKDESHLYLVTYLFRCVCVQISRGEASASWSRQMLDKAVYESRFTDERTTRGVYYSAGSRTSENQRRMEDALSLLEVKTGRNPNPVLVPFMQYWATMFRAKFCMETVNIDVDGVLILVRLGRKVSRRSKGDDEETESVKSKASKASKSSKTAKSIKSGKSAKRKHSAAASNLDDSNMSTARSESDEDYDE